MPASSHTLPRGPWAAPSCSAQGPAAAWFGAASSGVALCGALLAGHVALGWLLSQSKAVATIHAVVATVAAFGLTLSIPRPTVVLAVCCYIAGCEVLWRMSGAAIFWETAKYVIALALVISLGRRENARAPAAAVFYFALLLPSSLLTLAYLDWTPARQQLSFNLSGPLALSLAVIYFSNVRFRMQDLRTAAMALAAPAIAIAAVVARRITALGEIDFGMDSNFAASGGFGPNQVAAVLGLGALVCLLSALFCRLGTVERWASLTLFAALLLQSALTFSRGGAYLALAASGGATLFLCRTSAARGKLLLAASVLTAAGFAALPYADAWAGGLLIERFTTPDLTHRDQLLRDDLAVWAEHPVFGVGPGRASEERGTEFGGAAAHTEYTRALAEHGLFGLASVAILAGMTWRRFSSTVDPAEKALLVALLLWPLLFMGVNSMRLVAPSLLFGLAFAHWAPATSPANAFPEAFTFRRRSRQTSRQSYRKTP